MDLLIRNVAVLDASQDDMVTGMNIAISGSYIEQVTSSPIQPGPLTRVIDGKNRLAIPGLINAHTHSPENLLKARIEGASLEAWLFHLFWASPLCFTEREIYLVCLVGAIEMVKLGVTSVIDHVWMNGPFTLSSLDSVMSAYRDIGVRAGVAPLVEDEPKINQHLTESGSILSEANWAAPVPVTAREYLDTLEGFFQKWHLAEGGRLRCLAGPSGLQWVSQECLEGAMEIALRHAGGLHMHLNETKLQAHFCQDYFGKSAVAFLHENGFLRENTSLAHCVWITSDDIDRLAESGATVVHNPVCNLRLGSGFAPVINLVERGANVAIATDGAASNDNQNMFEAMKVAGLMHTVHATDPQRWPRARQLFRMATQGGAKVLGLSDNVGRIAPGQLADVILLDLTTPAFTPLNDPFLHLAFSENGSSVRTVIVDGRVILDEGGFLSIDETVVLAEVRQMWERRKRQIPPLSDQARLYLQAQERDRSQSARWPFPN
jgi:5-methylthioadenosine/S-adenosylhomocysteine deaminase